VCALGYVIATGCAKSEGVVPDNGTGATAGADASLGGGGGALGGAAGSSGAGASGGAAGAGASGGVAGAGASGGTSGSGGGTGGSGGGTGGSGGGTGGSGGGTGGTGGGTGGTGGGTGGTGGGTGGTGGGTGGSGGFGGCAVTSYDFASCTGFTAGGTKSDWQCGVPSSGPGADHTGGGQCWGTNLSGNSNNCADSTLTSPTIDLSSYGGQALRLQLYQWYDFRACVAGGLCGVVCAFDTSTYSGGVVEAYNGSSWQKITPTGGYGSNSIDCYYVNSEGGVTCQPCALDGVKGFSGATGAWVPVEFDISSYAINNFQFRFHFASYESEFLCHPAKAGWYVDDIRVAKLSCP
jgi:hypothetical protein